MQRGTMQAGNGIEARQPDCPQPPFLKLFSSRKLNISKEFKAPGSDPHNTAETGPCSMGAARGQHGALDVSLTQVTCKAALLTLERREKY